MKHLQNFKLYTPTSNTTMKDIKNYKPENIVIMENIMRKFKDREIFCYTNKRMELKKMKFYGVLMDL